MTSLLCKPGEVATIFNASAPPYFPASNNTVNSTSTESNSSLANNTITAAAQQPQIKKNDDTISFKATLEPPSYSASTTFLIYHKGPTLLLALKAQSVLLITANKSS
ncbi:MAG: hypothetical protein ACJ71C_01330 [Nitrososphaeraceae archaeon]